MQYQKYRESLQINIWSLKLVINKLYNRQNRTENNIDKLENKFENHL